MRHHFGGVPHRVIDDDGAILGLAERPLVIEVDDLRDVGAPYDAVTRCNHLDVETVDCLERRLCLLGIEEEDVRVVLLCLIDDNREVVVVVIALARGVVLPECVVREEDLLLGAVRYHAVRPVEHRGRDERQRSLANRECVARLHGLIGHLSVVGAQPLQPVRCACDDLRIRCKARDERHAVRMIRLDVVRDNVVDLRWVDDRGNA